MWIGLINNEPNKSTPLQVIWEAARRGKYEIWTSTYTYLEVIKGRALMGDPYPPLESDKHVDNILEQAFVNRVQLDSEIGRRARQLKRDLHAEGLSKRSDAIHLATAIQWNVADFHTWDKSDLLQFDGKLKCKNGQPLVVRIPGPDEYGPLFAGIGAA